MNILLLTTKYPIDAKSPYLTNELCEALICRGYSVDVICIDWHNDNGHDKVNIKTESSRVLSIPRPRFKPLPRPIQKLATWLFSSLLAYLLTRKEITKKKYDFCIVTTPISIFSLFLLLYPKKFRSKLVAICWDFFPIHQVELGLIPKFMKRPLQMLEAWLFNACDRISLPNKQYSEFLKENYAPRADINLITTNLWGGNLVAANQNIRTDFNHRKTVVFGGQMIAGRGLENIIALSRAAALTNPNLKIKLIGKGSNMEHIAEIRAANHLSNIVIASPTTREAYLKEISQCLAGIISLDRSTTTPSFPSKIVDYTFSGLPIIALDSFNRGLKEFIELNEIGYYFADNDSARISTALLNLLNADQWSQYSENSRRAHSLNFNVMSASKLIIPDRLDYT